MDNALTHTATYWAPGTPDGYGGQTFPAPVTIACRWEDVASLYVSAATGKQEVAKTRVFMETAVALDGYLYLGDSTSTTPQSVTGASIIVGVSRIKSMDDIDTLYTVYL